jgi:anti-sigma factor RsiW
MENHGNAELLLEYSAGTLETDAAAAVAEHIGNCAACRELVRAQQEVWSALEIWESRPVSPEFDQKLYRRIVEEVSWWELVTRPFRSLSYRHGLPLAAAACLLLVAGFLLQQQPEGIEPNEPNRPETVQQQVDAQHALEDLQILGEFNGLVRAEGGEPRM